ncbi:MAG: hypothetical protein OFPI_16430 [Osedax symbiont Rs2]|nr:MAG: hypothetical protein OFPI_16430 [Osedax symbiont Rs2]
MLTAQKINQLFMLFAEENKQLIAQLRNDSPEAIVDRQWQFSLPMLHQFMQHFYSLEDSDYQKFRSTLFNSSINHDLAAAGWIIKIAINRKNVDRSVYVLQRLEP